MACPHGGMTTPVTLVALISSFQLLISDRRLRSKTHYGECDVVRLGRITHKIVDGAHHVVADFIHCHP